MTVLMHVEKFEHYADREPLDAARLRELDFIRILARLADDLSVDLDGWNVRLVLSDDAIWLEFQEVDATFPDGMEAE